MIVPNSKNENILIKTCNMVIIFSAFFLSMKIPRSLLLYVLGICSPLALLWFGSLCCLALPDGAIKAASKINNAFFLTNRVKWSGWSRYYLPIPQLCYRLDRNNMLLFFFCAGVASHFTRKIHNTSRTSSNLNHLFMQE